MKTFNINQRCNSDSEGNGGDGVEGSANVFTIEPNNQYTVEKNQELVNSGVFNLHGELVLDGKWALLGDSVNLSGSTRSDNSTHSHNVLELNNINLVYINGVYSQFIYHNQNTFPIFKFLDENGTEMDFKVTHLSLHVTKIESNINVGGKIYML